jgi:hypothetical protein
MNNKRTDPQGWSTKVTKLGDGTYGCRVLRNGKIHSEGKAKTRREVPGVLRELLRWVDKLGFDSEMADASRSRQKR